MSAANTAPVPSSIGAPISGGWSLPTRWGVTHTRQSATRALLPPPRLLLLTSPPPPPRLLKLLLLITALRLSCPPPSEGHSGVLITALRLSSPPPPSEGHSGVRPARALRSSRRMRTSSDAREAAVGCSKRIVGESAVVGGGRAVVGE